MEIPKIPVREFFDVLIVFAFLLFVASFVSPFTVLPRLNLFVLAFGIFNIGVVEKWIHKEQYELKGFAPAAPRERRPTPISWAIEAMGIFLIAVSILHFMFLLLWPSLAS